MSLICKIETPASVADSDLATYEYMLLWKDRKGLWSQWLFLDRDIQIKQKATSKNLNDADKIGSIIEDEQTEITLIADDLTRNQLDVLQSIAVSRDVYRVNLDGTNEKVAVIGNTKSFKNSNQKFSFEVPIIPQKNYLQK